ncbi:MAG: phosphatidylserine decarboxylase [Thermoplasmata archaeon]
MFAPHTGRFLGIAAAALVALTLLWALAGERVPLVIVPLLVGLGALWVFLAAFFRDPERRTGAGIVSAADGRIREVVRDSDRWRISVFMNVTNVHVNRFPIDGRLVHLDDSGAGYRPAYQVDAAHNRQRRYTLETALGQVDVIQMTGILARRLVSFVKVGEAHVKGDRIGMIILGSRVDVLLPASRAAPAVHVGERVRAGVTTIARELP